MNRRDFLKQTVVASGALMMPSFLQASAIDQKFKTNKRLVLIQLSGGNDGLNTIVPFRNDTYYKFRPNIALNKTETLGLNDDLRWHSSLKNLKSLYDDGSVAVVHNVGYPNPNRSHSRATAIWQTASDANEYFQSGWVGRYLDYHKSNVHDAIAVDDSLSLLMKGEAINGLAIKDARLFYKNTQEPYFKKIMQQQKAIHLSEHNLGYLYKTMVSAESTASYVYEKYRTYNNSSVSYPSNAFGKQLKTTATFINSGLETKIYYVTLGGFDTHAKQTNKQARLLKIYDEGIAAFVKDLKAQGNFDDTLIMTFSEFGRRVQQNAAHGTDHGSANQLFFIGNQLKKPGMYNERPNLNRLDTNGDLKFSIDFRSAYAAVLKDWLNTSPEGILKGSFAPLDLL
jgi:uncharacterized protein (DUF1501 family)